MCREQLKSGGERADEPRVGVEPVTVSQSNAATNGTGAAASTAQRDAGRPVITKTTITPAAGHEPQSPVPVRKPPLRDRFRRSAKNQIVSAKEPYPGTNVLRLVLASLLSALCMLTVGGAILMLLLWQQERASGVLTSQLDRTWDLFDLLRRIERWVAFAVVPVAAAWIMLAVLNVRRATGQRRNPVAAALSLPIGVIGIWLVGDRIVASADDVLGQASGFVLQLVFLALPLLALERVATTAEARHRPLRAATIIAAVYLAQLQFLGALSTIEPTSQADEWGRLGAYLIIGALILVLGTLASNEAARAIEEGSEHRYELRHRFGESLLAQAARG